jgi:hypothetical protein
MVAFRGGISHPRGRWTSPNRDGRSLVYNPILSRDQPGPAGCSPFMVYKIPWLAAIISARTDDSDAPTHPSTRRACTRAHGRGTSARHAREPLN